MAIFRKSSKPADFLRLPKGKLSERRGNHGYVGIDLNDDYVQGCGRLILGRFGASDSLGFETQAEVVAYVENGFNRTNDPFKAE